MSGAKAEITPFFHEQSSSWSYVVSAAGAVGAPCAVIDPVLDFDGPRAHTSTTFADTIISHIRDKGLRLERVLETHAHADRLSAAPYLKQQLGGRIGIGAAIGKVQDRWNQILNLSGAGAFSTAAFDDLWDDGAVIALGPLALRVWHTPGHTPADATYLLGDAAFIGDTLFMPDYGTARVDFPDGDATQLYRTIRRILDLPGDTRLYLCHDYLTETRQTHSAFATVADERRDNIHARDGVSKADFTAMRVARDKTLNFPALLLYAVPFNLAGGRAQPAEGNGKTYLKVPFDYF
jgi:glyoxylase-like metal-dependent hydrolase (beta-lactamase superfamily II)